MHQIQSYYRRGMPDSCQNVIEDLKICMQIKLLKISEPDEAKVRASDRCGRQGMEGWGGDGRRWAVRVCGDTIPRFAASPIAAAAADSVLHPKCVLIAHPHDRPPLTLTYPPMPVTASLRFVSPRTGSRAHVGSNLGVPGGAVIR